jgi:hypothetical protein
LLNSKFTLCYIILLSFFFLFVFLLQSEHKNIQAQPHNNHHTERSQSHNEQPRTHTSLNNHPHINHDCSQQQQHSAKAAANLIGSAIHQLTHGNNINHSSPSHHVSGHSGAHGGAVAFMPNAEERTMTTESSFDFPRRYPESAFSGVQLDTEPGGVIALESQR